MKEDLYELYKLNENYHDQKENKIWLSFGLYYSYSIACIAAIYQYSGIINISQVLMFSLLDIIIFILASIFVYKQTELKCRSVLKTAVLAKRIAEEYSEDDKNYLCNQIWFDIFGLEYKDCFIIEFNEIILYLLAIVLFLAKYILAFSQNIILCRIYSLSYVSSILLIILATVVGVTLLKLCLVERKSKGRIVH